MQATTAYQVRTLSSHEACSGCADGCAIATSRASDWRRDTAGAPVASCSSILGILCTAAGMAAPLTHWGTCVIDVRDVWFQHRYVSGEARWKRPDMPLPILPTINGGARLSASATRVCAAVHVARQRGDGRLAVLHKRTGTASGDTAACS